MSGVRNKSGVASERWRGWSGMFPFIQDAVKAVLKCVRSALIFPLRSSLRTIS